MPFEIVACTFSDNLSEIAVYVNALQIQLLEFVTLVACVADAVNLLYVARLQSTLHFRSEKETGSS